MSTTAVLIGTAPAIVHDVHRAFAWFVVVSNGIVGAWALAADRWEQLRHPGLWWATWVAHGSIFVQVAIGVWAAQGFRSDHLQMHMFYGFIAAFSVAIIFSYRAQLAEHRYKLYGFGGLFLTGLGIRAMILDPLS